MHALAAAELVGGGLAKRQGYRQRGEAELAHDLERLRTQLGIQPA
jgi:hypothetical protein